MDDVKAALSLERLDDETAMFVGGDTARVTHQSFFGQVYEMEGRFPLVTLPREAWVDLGCPTMLILTLAEFVVSNDEPA